MPGCHAERSEASVAMGCEMLRCAQHDSGAFPSCCVLARREDSLLVTLSPFASLRVNSAKGLPQGKPGC